MLGSLTLTVAADELVIGSDGFLYTVDGDFLRKIDLATGVVAATSTPAITANLLRRNASGSKIFTLSSNGLGTGVAQRFSVSPGNAATHGGTLFASNQNDRDLSVDESRNGIYRAAGGIYGIEVLNLATGLKNVWPFDDPYGVALAQHPGLPSIFGASGDQIIREFDKSTGKVLNTFDHENFAAGHFPGTVMGDRMEIAANGIVVYGKDIDTGSE